MKIVNFGINHKKLMVESWLLNKNVLVFDIFVSAGLVFLLHDKPN